jgi:anti-anti-sigma regulatory factor/HAMP domain-containing protein
LQANHIAADTDGDRAGAERRMDELGIDMQWLLDLYEQKVDSNHEHEGVALVSQKWQSLLEENQMVLLPNSHLNNDDLALAVFTQQESRYKDVLKELQSLVDATQDELAASQQTIRDSITTTQNLLYGFAIGAILLAIGFGAVLARTISGGFGRLLEATHAIAAGDLTRRLPAEGKDELSTLGASFNTMQAALHNARNEIETQRVELAQRADALERMLADLQTSTRAREQLQATVNTLASPIVPVLNGVLVMPLIGVIDADRAQQIMTATLQAIEQYRAKIIILDVTGVPVVDTLVAQALMQVAESARLLGAQPVLVGLRPELAQTIVGLGLDLSRLITRSDLQSGVEYALNRVKRPTNR